MPRLASLSPVLALLVLALVPATAAAQTTWHVDANYAGCPGSGSASDPFCTIGAALSAASPGDTIQVAAGHYAENLQITTDDLRLVGAGADVTTISGPANVAVVWSAANLPSGSIEGFRITSTGNPESTIGISADQQTAVDPHWRISRCLVEGVALGIRLSDSYDAGAQLLVEDTVVTNCGTGFSVVGLGSVIRRCTITEIDSVGVFGSFPNTRFVVSDSIIAGTGWWAVQRYWGSGIGITIERVLVHNNNQENPEACVGCGPFVMYLAEGFPGGFGVYSDFTPMPGPALFEDPLFVDAGASDVRLTAGSPAIDIGDPAAVPAAGAYDALGFGHPRVDDGDFDGAARLDLGAIEFGGLLTNAGLDGTLGVGQAFALTQSGKPGALYAVFVGLPGPALDLGPKGTLFLLPSPLLWLTTGVLPAGGTATVLAGLAPPAAAGFDVRFQAAQKGPGGSDGLHWTNLERLAIVP
jgi:hypothetical protein